MTSLQVRRRFVTPLVVLLGLLPAGLLAWNALNGLLSANPIKDITEAWKTLPSLLGQTQPAVRYTN